MARLPVPGSDQGQWGDLLNEFLRVAHDEDGQLAYNRGGTGAVDRTVQSKLQEFASIKDFGAVGDGSCDDTAAIQAAIDAARFVLIPAGAYRVCNTLRFATSRQKLIGQGFASEFQFTGSGVCIDFDGWAGCSVEDLLVHSTGGTTGIRIGPNFGETRFAHWWRLKRVMVVGNTPNWASTSLVADRSGFSTAGIEVVKAFYGHAEQTEVSYTTGYGFRLSDQANGNTFTACHTRDCATGLGILGDQASNGNIWTGGNIEASIAGSIGIEINEADRNIVSGRMEVSVDGGAHVVVNPTTGDGLAQENQFLGLCLTGTSAGYVLGDGLGTSEVRGTFISGGKLGASLTINSDCIGTLVELSTTGASGVPVTDNGYGTILRLDVGGSRWYERPISQNSGAYDHDLLVTTGSVAESMGENNRTMSFADAPTLFTWKKVSVTGAELPVMMFGGYRVWVSPLDGRMYIKGSDPTSHSDGTVVGSQI